MITLPLLFKGRTEKVHSKSTLGMEEGIGNVRKRERIDAFVLVLKQHYRMSLYCSQLSNLEVPTHSENDIQPNGS